MSSGSAFSQSQWEQEPTSPTSPTCPSTCSSSAARLTYESDGKDQITAWAEDLSDTVRSSDLHRTATPDTDTASPSSSRRGVCSLASSAQQFMERKRQAEELESAHQMEWQHFIRKRNSSGEDPEDDASPVTRLPSRAVNSSPQPLSIVELYQLCNQVSKTLLVPIAEVKACFDDFVALDLDGSFTLSADEFEKAVRRSCRLTDSEMLPENLALKYPQMDADGNRVVDFKEYVRWSQGASWSEQLLVRDDRDREARRLAKVYGIHLLDVERLRRLFDSYATNQRVITQDRFAQVIRGVLKVSDPSDVPQSRLERYWREIDLDGSGTVDFEEFVIWMNDRGPQQPSFLTRD